MCVLVDGALDEPAMGACRLFKGPLSPTFKMRCRKNEEAKVNAASWNEKARFFSSGDNTY